MPPGQHLRHDRLTLSPCHCIFCVKCTPHPPESRKHGIHGYPISEGSTHTALSGASDTVFQQLGMNSTQGWNLMPPWLPSVHSASPRSIRVGCVVLQRACTPPVLPWWLLRKPPVHPWWPPRAGAGGDRLVPETCSLLLLRSCLRDHNTIQTRALCEDDPLLLYTPSAPTSCAGGCLGSVPLRIALQPRRRAAPG